MDLSLYMTPEELYSLKTFSELLLRVFSFKNNWNFLFSTVKSSEGRELPALGVEGILVKEYLMKQASNLTRIMYHYTQ